ncbi:hypothetical protein G9A89_004224 [Geosiphon pyriformis]|nr:hypothetical protein G9A89_004224 [Geosiphon pyriformis]
MEPVNSSAGGLGLILAGLGTCQSAKNKHMDMVYSHSAFYKKPKKLVANNVIDLFAGLLSIKNISGVSVKPEVSWGSEVNSIAGSISNLLNVENMANTVAEETNYAESGEDDNMDNAIPRKTHIWMYVLDNPLRQPFFESMSDDNIALELPFHVDIRSNQVLLLKSHVLGMQCFNLMKSFVLDIELSVVPSKLIGDKLISIKKIFYQVDGFGGASTLSKFPGIIRSFFTSESSLNKAKVLVISNKILVNNDLRRVNSQSAVESVFSKFGKIILIKMQLIGLWQKAIIEFKLSEVAISTTAYDLSVLVEAYDEKTYRCAVICFKDRASKLAAIGSVPVFKSVSLCWASLLLAYCAKCKQFGHVSDVCSVVTDQDWVCLANIYKKKQAPIICPVSFNGKTWAQVAGGSSFLLGSLSPLGTDLSLGTKFSIGAWSFSNNTNPYGVSSLFNHLVSLEWSLELLTDQISDIVRKLSFVELVPLPSVFYELPLAVSIPLAPEVNSNMVLDSAPEPSAPFFSAVVDNASGFSLNSSKILTTKMSGLESKITSLEGINVPAKQVDVVCWHISSGNMVSFITETKLRSSSELWIKDKYDGVRIFTSGLDVGYLGAGVAVIMNNFLAHHVSKIEVVPGWVISVWLLFKDKLLVSVLGLYTGASAGIHFGQAFEVNSIIAKAINTSTFVVLGGDFNKYRSGRSASFKFCSSLGLVNLFNGHYLIKAPMWCNSRDAERIIDYIFVSKSLFSTIAKCWVSFVSDFFDMNHNAVVVSVSLTYKDCWKFKIKNVDSTRWSHFRDCSSIRILIIKVKFLAAAVGYDLNAMWSLLERALLLVAKIVKRLESDDAFRFDYLVEKWSTLDADKAFVLRNMVHADQKIMNILKYLSIVRKEYRKSKIYELKLAQEAFIRAAIEKCMGKLCSDKDSMIRNVLDRSFQKVVLDHLVVDDELVLDSDRLKLNIDRIMEDWTRKRVVFSALSDLWAHQYAPLDYVRDNAFFGVMDAINMSELFVIVGGLSNGKAAGLSGILNKLWKHGGKSVMECFLVLLNECLFVDRIFTNTHPIALIKTVRKILSKILSDRISFTCSKFGVLCGNNFSVLKSIFTQILVFAVGSVVEDTLEKNKELWLVLQNMCKTYDSVGWYHLKTSLWHIKMYNRFIKFFGSIHENRINRVMTDFGEIFSPLLWKIFYDPPLCEVKRHEHLCEYQINTKFVAKSGRVESSDRMFSFFAAGAFVDDTIWIRDCQALMQYALDISIKITSLNINGQPISIAKKGKAHRYLGIFLSIKGLSKPSLAKAYLNVHFFANVVLRKAIIDKQFSYLVLAILQPIVNYYIQFSFVSSNVYHKWDALVKKSLKLKAGLPHDFFNAALHYLSLYGLKSFEQIQAESKLAAVVIFFNALGILEHLFDYRFLDLQVLGWASLDPLQFSVKLHVSSVNNFLAGVVKIFLDNKLFLVNNLPCTFYDLGNFSMSLVLGSASYFGSVCFLKQFGVVFEDRLLDKKSHVMDWKTFYWWKRLDSRGSVSYWFDFTSGFLCDGSALSSGLARAN